MGRNLRSSSTHQFIMSDVEKASGPYNEKVSEPQAYNGENIEGEVHENVDFLHRRLGNRQIQLIAIGGSIGTALFVGINTGLYLGGSGSLFISYFIYSIMLAFVNNCIAEMTVYQPVSGGFVRLAGEYVDEAFGFMAGWNFFLYEALLIPFEITAISTVLSYWRDDIPAAAVVAVSIFLYGCCNILAVKVYGEAEFWLSGGKAILIILLFCFTFVTMVGGNPQGDAYGFRNWNRPEPFLEYRTTGSLGRFEGFLAALFNGSFTIVGPEYISMVAAEAKRPRIYIKTAFKTVYFRFMLFFIGGALAVGIVCSPRDETLVAIKEGTSGGSGTASASPYVIAMTNFGIDGLPHLVNALLVTSIFSAGNTYTYCATRTLYGLALEGRAPAFFKRCWKNGVPYFAFALVMCFPYLFWWRALKVQGFDRNKLPYKGWFQPYSAYIGVIWMTFVLFCYGYTAFKPWSLDDFFIYYTMLIAAVVFFIGWKIVKRTKFVKSSELDLVWEAPAIDAYEATFYEPPMGFWR